MIAQTPFVGETQQFPGAFGQACLVRDAGTDYSHPVEFAVGLCLQHEAEHTGVPCQISELRQEEFAIFAFEPGCRDLGEHCVGLLDGLTLEDCGIFVSLFDETWLCGG